MAENKCDELFGKNGELVEFRKKMVLEGSLGIIRRHYKDKSNKMEVIAALFGKKLGEEFTVKVPQYDEYGEIKQYQNVKGYFCERGFRSEQINFADTFIFAELLEGYAVIVNEV